MTLQKILYATIKTYELEERINRDDETFDAFEYLSGKIGHKNPSTLRKMCESRSEGSNVAKLGFDEALIIMSITRDYRLHYYPTNELKAAQVKDQRQLSLFAKPIHHLELAESNPRPTKDPSAGSAGLDADTCPTALRSVHVGKKV